MDFQDIYRNDDLQLFGLDNYLKFIYQHFGIQITIKDRIHFIRSMDKEITASLIPYLSHQNCYCKYIKMNPELHKKCLLMSNLIENKLRKRAQPFFGVCHAGVGEYIVPITYKNKQIIGFITIGPFNVPEKIIRRRVEKMRRFNQIDYNLAKRYYCSISKIDIPDSSWITGMFKIVAEHLSLIHYCNVISGKYIKKQTGTFREEIILNKIFEYINQNFYNNLSLQNISKYCYCSKSYISHIFKKSTGLSLSEYIIRIRLREAKMMLVNTEQTITRIALLNGFNDSSYFTKVFKKINGITPSKFRKINR